MKSNFDFLKEKFPELAKFGELAEKYLYDDPVSSLIKLRMIEETMVTMIQRFDNVWIPKEKDAAYRINELYHQDLLTQDLREILHALRKAGNYAVHRNQGTVDETKTLLEMAYSLCEWFYQTYGDWEYEHRDYVMPERERIRPSMEAPAAEEEPEDHKLLEAAANAAAAAPKISREERKHRAHQAANQRPRSEAETRYMIDEQLRKVGWEADTQKLRYAKGARPQKGHNMAIAEWPTDSDVGNRGYADYVLFIGQQMVGVIEAKAIHKDISSVIDGQCKEYARLIRKKDEKYIDKFYGDYKVPFVFATNGRPYIRQYETKSGIWFDDLRDPSAPPRALHGWMSPIGLAELLEKDPEMTNARLKDMPFDLLRDQDGLHLRDYQIRAIEAAENAIADGQKKVLLAMATGTGKTRTVLGMIYRFLKSGRFRRILFLVDRNALGQQAGDTFKEVKIEDLMPLSDIYNIKDLEDKTIDKETRVQIATVQSMVKRILYNEDDTMPAVTDYDLLIIDEAHRGYILDREMTEEEALYSDQKDYQSKYRAVIDYFDAVKIALTATPALQTTEIFGPPVFQYSYREAVIEGYLVDHDAPHRIETKLGTEGIHYREGDSISVYDPKTGEVTDGALLDDELDFDIESFNKKVVTESFNRTVLEEIAKDLDPEGEEKTLIYAVDDQHADLIVKILKEIYARTGVDQDAIMKITGSIGGGNSKKVQEAIRRFKNEHYPTIVVTVDLLTTGINVPAITTLVFLRRVKSRILFEQMLGRATRLCPQIHKTHFEIYDPVGVYDSLETVNTMKPVVANLSVTISQVLDRMETTENNAELQYQIGQIAAKLQRKSRQMDKDAIEHFRNLFGGMSPGDLAMDLPKHDPKEMKQRLLAYKEQFQKMQQIRVNGNHQVVISDAADELISHTRGYGEHVQRPEDYLESFSEYINSHVNELVALKTICTKPADLTRQDLKSLRLTLDSEGYSLQQLNTAISQMTSQEITADIISIIRRCALGSPLVSHEKRIHKAVEKLRKAHSFTRQEENWLKRIEKYLLEESVLNVEVFDEDSRFRAQGGFKKINKVFGNELKSIVLELNAYLYDDGGKRA